MDVKKKRINGWRILHHKEIYLFFSSPNIIRLTKRNRIRQAPEVTRSGKNSNFRKIYMKERDNKALW